MELRFETAVMVAMVAVIGLADSKVTITAFRDALASRDVLECQRVLTPLFVKATDDGAFNDRNTRDAVLTTVADGLLQLRIVRGDDAIGARFKGMETLMWQIACCDEIARTNVYFLKLADYMADERAIPVEGRVAEIKEARQRDEALIASGTIEAPVVYTAYPRTPNLLALRREYDSIDRWNSAVKKHRNAVAFCFARPMSQYLSTMKDEEARSRFRRFFSERARLSAEEEKCLFGVVAERGDPNASVRKQKEPK